MSILIKNALVGQQQKDIFIEGTQISRIEDSIEEAADTVIDASNMLASPPFVNGHTHGGMSLLRGFADDMHLQEWLEDHIWPAEAKLTDKAIYWGNRLACIEMIRSGTTFFNDMYWQLPSMAQAVKDAGIKAALSETYIDFLKHQPDQLEAFVQRYNENKDYNERIQTCVAPHSIYTVSGQALQWIGDFARRNGIILHFHLSETQKEVDDCLSEHGMRPVHYLDQLGVLGPNVVAAHGVWLDEGELDILAERGVTLVYNPISNMKLAVGATFPYQKASERGIPVLLGTDSSCSNNNLDMVEEMKVGSLLQKHANQDPTALPAHKAYASATQARVFGVEGKLEPGAPADLILIDLSHVQKNPQHNIVSNLVYASSGAMVDTTICDGSVLMRHRELVYDNEEEVLRRVAGYAQEL